MAEATDSPALVVESEAPATEKSVFDPKNGDHLYEYLQRYMLQIHHQACGNVSLAKKAKDNKEKLLKGSKMTTSQMDNILHDEAFGQMRFLHNGNVEISIDTLLQNHKQLRDFDEDDDLKDITYYKNSFNLSVLFAFSQYLRKKFLEKAGHKVVYHRAFTNGQKGLWHFMEIADEFKRGIKSYLEEDEVLVEEGETQTQTKGDETQKKVEKKKVTEEELVERKKKALNDKFTILEDWSNPSQNFGNGHIVDGKVFVFDNFCGEVGDFVNVCFYTSKKNIDYTDPKSKYCKVNDGNEVKIMTLEEFCDKLGNVEREHSRDSEFKYSIDTTGRFLHFRILYSDTYTLFSDSKMGIKPNMMFTEKILCAIKYVVDNLEPNELNYKSYEQRELKEKNAEYDALMKQVKALEANITALKAKLDLRGEPHEPEKKKDESSEIVELEK